LLNLICDGEATFDTRTLNDASDVFKTKIRDRSGGIIDRLVCRELLVSAIIDLQLDVTSVDVVSR